MPNENLNIRSTSPSKDLEGTARNECKDVLCHRNIWNGLRAFYVDIQ
jgi:hypothetical protein